MDEQNAAVDVNKNWAKRARREEGIFPAICTEKVKRGQCQKRDSNVDNSMTLKSPI